MRFIGEQARARVETESLGPLEREGTASPFDDVDDELPETREDCAVPKHVFQVATP